MSHIQIFDAHRVPPAWEKARLLRRVARAMPGRALPSDLSVGERYFVRGDGDAPDAALLERVLGARRVAPGEAPAGCPECAGSATHRLYAPRAGTISPWSDKATDILRTAVGSGVGRLERARIVSLYGVPMDCVADLDAVLHDRMTERPCEPDYDGGDLFVTLPPRPLRRIGDGALPDIRTANQALNLALSDDEVEFLERYAADIGRALTDAELLMFAQINSEHCRHKIFNAEWVFDGKPAPRSLFEMIRHTHAHSPANVLVAYDDNSAVIAGPQGVRWQREPANGEYVGRGEDMHILMKVETHNHPTAISPFPGAATGVGGEIRDEAATGRGGRPQAGLCGYVVSDLCLHEQADLPEELAPSPWETVRPQTRPANIESAFEIMLKAPIGAASYGNEFGRPNTAGVFRTFERRTRTAYFAYDKPIMLAGGMGTVRPALLKKERFGDGVAVVVLGGAGMLIGLGGGTGSSQGAAGREADYASVQRDNPEIQRRCQEVIERCVAMGEANPISSIHDVGAGGLSNAVPELLNDAGCGGDLNLRAIPTADSALSPMEIWCNEAQERYVLAVHADALAHLEEICARERCPMAVIGHANRNGKLELRDADAGQDDAQAIHMPMEALFKRTPRKRIEIASPKAGEGKPDWTPVPLDSIDIEEAMHRVLTLPAVAAKQFLITIADRTVGGLTARDQLVGPWQMPVADCAVSCTDYEGVTGSAMALGERTPVAVDDACAAARLSVCEAVTNLLAADVGALGDIKLSANWMAAMDDACDDYKKDLYAAVREVGEVLCPALGMAVPVGKDSLSMRTVSPDGKGRFIAPVSLIISAFAPVSDVRKTLTPELNTDENTTLYLIDLSNKKNNLGGSALAQCYRADWGRCADLDDAGRLRSLFGAMQALRRSGVPLAWHDRSDGGLWACVCEMAFATRCGLDLDLSDCGDEFAGVLFAEEPGGVLQVARENDEVLREAFAQNGLEGALHRIGEPVPGGRTLTVNHRKRTLSVGTRGLRASWWKTSFLMQTARDNPECAKEEYEAVLDGAPGLHAHLSFQPPMPPAGRHRASVAVLREQGTNGHMEMAAALSRVGFRAMDVHMSDLLEGRVRLDDYRGLALCGGFSYGDVLGAGRGWALSVLHHAEVRAQFQAFFERPDTFTLGVCNGCQTLAHLRELIPGAAHWPAFERNRSGQFEARLSMVEITDSPSILLRGMSGSRLPIVVSHGEGRAAFASPGDHKACRDLIGLRYIDGQGRAAQSYPANPNGSEDGVAGLCNANGRVTLMMPHPERLFRNEQFSWRADWGEASPWLRLFDNAHQWASENT